MPKLLALAPYPYRSADTRYRICQFVPYLERMGWEVTVRPFMDDKFFQMYHRPGHTLEKVLRTIYCTVHRLQDVVTASRFDSVLLHKEAFPFGPPIVERLLRKQVKHLVYDMDDAFWTHPAQIKQIGASFRDSNRIAKIISMVDHVLAGNEYLANYARHHNNAVTVFPTVLDLHRYLQRIEQDDGVVTIGWIGRWSSAPYLKSMEPVFVRLAEKYPQIRIKLIGAENISFNGVDVKVVPWRLETEVESIAQFDIGIMPLPDDSYSQGKCGFKLLQYMALGIPSVASPVGVNQVILQDSVNGFVASNENEWVDKLARLVESKVLRKQIGIAGRKTVEESFSVGSHVNQLSDILKN